ncbi:DNA-binding GntR family transcriptional regulator [Bradyrhizobium sp. AZCC 1610]|uniref:UTRA domain-containing protein n=1 Tax=Bradyrhizobium sp. AZCC 1610 TaxID=3117020 RepID=UPI002FEFD893
MHQTVAAAVVPNEFAKALGADAGSAVLEVLRRYLDSHGRLFEISESIHPARRYVVTSVLKRVDNPGTADGRATRSSGKTRSRA